MKEFKDLGITVKSRSFSGQKININDLINVEIVVEEYKVEPSKFKKGEPCLHMQIRHNNEQRVVFISAKGLIETLDQVPADSFPFKTTIKHIDKRFSFT